MSRRREEPALIQQQATTASLEQARTDLSGAREQAASLGSDLAEREGELDDAEKEIESLLEGVSLDVVFLIDGTGSMGSWIDSLKRACDTIGELFPDATSHLRIGTVVYRNSGTEPTPLAEIKNPEDDGGASLAAFRKRVAAIEADGSVAAVQQAVREGMRMLDAERFPNTRSLLVLMGDVPPGEVAGDRPGDGERLCREVERWCDAAGHDRRTLSLFAGGGSQGAAGDPAREFFERFAAASENGVFTTDIEGVFKGVFKAAFAPRED